MRRAEKEEDREKEKKNDFKIQNSKRNTSDRNCTKEENDMKI